MPRALLSSVKALQINLSLPPKGEFWGKMRQAKNQAIGQDKEF